LNTAFEHSRCLGDQRSRSQASTSITPSYRLRSPRHVGSRVRVAGLLGPWLADRDSRIIVAVAAILPATMFVRIRGRNSPTDPLMHDQASDQELAAIGLGASGLRMLVA
jgi:hypothetical protein